MCAKAASNCCFLFHCAGAHRVALQIALVRPIDNPKSEGCNLQRLLADLNVITGVTLGRLFVVSALALTCLLGGALSISSAAAEACKELSTVAVTGVILFAHLTEEGWSILADNVAPCEVRELIGRGPLPAGCEFGKSLQATGSISAGGANMQVQTITCS